MVGLSRVGSDGAVVVPGMSDGLAWGGESWEGHGPMATTDRSRLGFGTLVVVMGDNGTKEPFTHILPDGTAYPGGKVMAVINSGASARTSSMVTC